MQIHDTTSASLINDQTLLPNNAPFWNHSDCLHSYC